MNRRSFLLIAPYLGASLLSVVAFFAGASFASETIVESAALYCPVVSEDGTTTLWYDGYKTSRVAADARVTDAAGSGIRDLASLADAIGAEPDWSDVKIGETIGAELNDVVYARLTLDDGVVTAIEATSRAPRPLVGIAWVGEKVTKTQIKVAGALLRNGARAVCLPKVDDDASCDAALDGIDGLFMPGGADVDPAYYGEEPYPHGSIGIDPVRDVSDILTTRAAIARNIPGWWVCRGEQTLNVALGGALIQDIPSYQGVRALKGEFNPEETSVLPDDGVPATYGGHEEKPCMPAHYRVRALGVNHSSGRNPFILTEESRFLRAIVGEGYPEPVTSHHQAADPARIGKGLTITAVAPDGIVEAIEYLGNDFALGTQFHPEIDALSEKPELAEFCAAFFRELIAASRAFAQKRAGASL